ncbi:MAG: V4R domain-containing protein, partial [Candidatus Adiutrix sp.]
MTNSESKYGFYWGLLGDIQGARPNLGASVRLEAYRLMQFCFRDILEKRYGTLEADLIFREAGLLAGTEFYENVIKPQNPTDFADAIRLIEETLCDMGIGILRVEKAELNDLKFTITVSEDLDCSGLPELNYETCIYDEGFLAGMLHGVT